MKKGLRSLGQILTSLLNVFLAVLLCGNLYILAARGLTGEMLPTIFGYSSVVVITGSMSDAIEINDVVVNRRQDSYETGDIITFESGSHLVTHRIAELTPEGFITKGDANNTTDTQPVPPENVVGKVVLVIPGVGAVVSFLQTQLGRLCLVMAALLLILFPSLMERRENIGDNDEE